MGICGSKDSLQDQSHADSDHDVSVSGNSAGTNDKKSKVKKQNELKIKTQPRIKDEDQTKKPVNSTGLSAPDSNDLNTSHTTQQNQDNATNGTSTSGSSANAGSVLKRTIENVHSIFTLNEETIKFTTSNIITISHNGTVALRRELTLKALPTILRATVDLISFSYTGIVSHAPTPSPGSGSHSSFQLQSNDMQKNPESVEVGVTVDNPSILSLNEIEAKIQPEVETGIEVPAVVAKQRTTSDKTGILGLGESRPVSHEFQWLLGRFNTVMKQTFGSQAHTETSPFLSLSAPDIQAQLASKSLAFLDTSREALVRCTSQLVRCSRTDPVPICASKRPEMTLMICAVMQSVFNEANALTLLLPSSSSSSLASTSASAAAAAALVAKRLQIDPVDKEQISHKIAADATVLMHCCDLLRYTIATEEDRIAACDEDLLHLLGDIIVLSTFLDRDNDLVKSAFQAILAIGPEGENGVFDLIYRSMSRFFLHSSVVSSALASLIAISSHPRGLAFLIETEVCDLVSKSVTLFKEHKAIHAYAKRVLRNKSKAGPDVGISGTIMQQQLSQSNTHHQNQLPHVQSSDQLNQISVMRQLKDQDKDDSSHSIRSQQSQHSGNTQQSQQSQNSHRTH